MVRYEVIVLVDLKVIVESDEVVEFRYKPVALEIVAFEGGPMHGNCTENQPTCVKIKSVST